MMTNLDVKSFYLSELPDLQESTTSHFFKPGQIIFYEGHIPYGLFILLDGTIEICVDNTSEKLEGCAILGINSFLNTRYYPVTAKAITTCKVNFLSKTAFHELSDKNYQVLSWIKE